MERERDEQNELHYNRYGYLICGWIDDESRPLPAFILHQKAELEHWQAVDIVVKRVIARLEREGGFGELAD